MILPHAKHLPNNGNHLPHNGNHLPHNVNKEEQE